MPRRPKTGLAQKKTSRRFEVRDHKLQIGVIAAHFDAKRKYRCDKFASRRGNRKRIARLVAPTPTPPMTAPSSHKPLIIGIAGGSGSGKSTVANNVADNLGSHSIAFIDMDAYYRNFTELTLDERKHLNWDHPDAFDFELLRDNLERLSNREPIEKPVYDFVTHLRSDETIVVHPSDVIVIDGILLFVDEGVRNLCDVKVFVDADADVRLIRRIQRDVSSRGRPLNEIIDQYLSTVHPMHQQFVEPSKRYADIIVPRGGHNSIAIEMIVAKIRQRLG